MAPPRSRNVFARIPTAAALAAITALGLSLRIWELGRQPWISIDGTQYVNFAEAILRGRAFLCPFPPGYPALIALVLPVVSDRVLAAQIVALACGAALPWATALLSRPALGERWALAPAFAVAVHPWLVQYSAVTMSESPYILAMTLAIVAAVAGRPLVAGLLGGAAFAIRPEALLPMATLVGLELTRAIRGRTRRLAPLLVFAGFLVCAVPCWIQFHATFGVWTLTPKIEAFRARSADWRADEPRAGTASIPAAERFDVGSRLGAVAASLPQYPANALAHGRSLLELWALPLILLSAWGLRRAGYESLPLLVPLVLPALGLTAQPRFHLALLPSLACLATIPIARAGAPASRRALAVAGVVGLAWTLSAAWPVLTRLYEGHAGAQEEAGTWLAGVAEPGVEVADRRPHVAFYAHRSYHPLRDGTYEEIVQDLIDRGTRYLVLDEGLVRVFRPQLAPLLYDTSFRERERRLDLLYMGGYVRGYSVAIFRVLRPGENPGGRPPVARIHWLEGANP